MRFKTIEIYKLLHLSYFVTFSVIGILFSVHSPLVYARGGGGRVNALCSFCFSSFFFPSFPFSFFFSFLLWKGWLHSSILQALTWIQMDNQCTHCQPATRGRCCLRSINLSVGHLRFPSVDLLTPSAFEALFLR